MQIIKPNTESQIENHSVSVFLAGSIEMGSAPDWQLQVQEALQEMPVTVYNPRRDDWDSSWKQCQFEEPFRSQVLWELSKMKKSDIIFMYLDPSTKSPISLLELGLHKHSNVIVCCPEGFWRKGNVDIVCEVNEIPVVDTLEKGIKMLQSNIRFHIDLLHRAHGIYEYEEQTN
jgi:Nucleoside 2-deoxyribosyltransferase like